MHDVSGSGISIRFIAIPTFPAGFTVEKFADDGDPLATDATTIANTGVTLNGEMVKWGNPNTVPMTVSVLPNTDEANNLQTLWDANRVSTQKLSARDIITAVVSYADGTTKVLSNGVMVDGPAFTGVTADARLQTKTFNFVFERCI